MSPSVMFQKNQELERGKNVALKTSGSVSLQTQGAVTREPFYPGCLPGVSCLLLLPAFLRPFAVPKPLSKWLVFNSSFQLLLWCPCNLYNSSLSMNNLAW